MSDQLIKTWQSAKDAVSKAKSWQDLPNGKSYQNDSFKISVAHCVPPKLTRAGQQSCGGKNYWETEEAFNKSMLEYIVNNWQNVYPEVIKIMEEKERTALIACQSYVNNLQSLVTEANQTEETK